MPDGIFRATILNQGPVAPRFTLYVFAGRVQPSTLPLVRLHDVEKLGTNVSG